MQYNIIYYVPTNDSAYSDRNAYAMCANPSRRKWRETNLTIMRILLYTLMKHGDISCSTITGSSIINKTNIKL